MLPLSYFQQIYVINLQSREDRRREMGEQLAKLGLDFGSRNVCLFPAVRPDTAADFPSVGARGCFLSHLGILRQATEHGFERILILEDDLNFAADFMDRIGGVIETLQSRTWNIFYGGYVVESLPGGSAYGGIKQMEPAHAIQTTHFVGFNGGTVANAAKYLESLLARPAGDPRGGPMHVDGAYNWYRRAYPEESTLICIPELGYQRSSRTDVHELRWFDRIPGIRSVVAGLRRFRNA